MKLSNSLAPRIWGPFLIMAALLTGVVGLYTPKQQENSLITFQKEELQLIAETVALAIEIALSNNDIASADRYFELIRDRENLEFGGILFDGDSNLVSIPIGLTTEELLRSQESPLMVEAPFSSEGLKGKVLIKGSEDFIIEELFKLNLPLYLGLVVVMAGVLLLNFFLRVQVAKPLIKLESTAENLGQGALDFPIINKSNIREIRSLNIALEQLRKGLLEQRTTNAELTRGMEKEIQRQTQDLRKTFEDLQDSQNLFGSVIESALDAMILADGQSKIMEWNRKAESIFGWSREEAVGQKLSDLIIPHKHRDAHNNGMDNYHSTGHGPVMNQTFETQGLRKNGEVFDIALYITQVQINNEVVFSSFIRDITESKQLTVALERERELNATLLNGLPMMASLKNEKLQFTFINDYACEVLGQVREEVIGKNEHEVFTADWVQESITLDRAGYNGEQVKKVERIFEVNGKPEKFLIGRHKFSVGTENLLLTYGFNISQLKDIQLELEAALKAKDEFLATISHEIRTPLHSIIVLAELLNNDKDLNEQFEYAANIRSSSRHLLSLVNDLLDFAKAEAGKLTLDPVPTDLAQYLDGLTRVDQEKRNPNVEFIKTIKGCNGTAVMLDTVRLNQVISNLLSNAFKFTEKGEVELIVESETQDNRALIRFEVRDTGIGISQENLIHILQPFHQAHTGISRQFGGTGLGLGIVGNLLTLMDSELQISSEPNRGSSFKFEIYVPITSQEKTAPAKHSNDDPSKISEIRLLYVEDMMPNQMVMKAMCKTWDVQLTMANGGMEAIQLVQKQKFDIILMDIQMPNMDGIEAFHKIQALDLEPVPIHAFTANGSEGDQASYLELGFKGVLTKPITPQQMKAFLIEYIHEQD